MKKLPYGISNYDKLVDENYYYVDKTEYIKKLENLTEKYVMFLRPRKFGKTLFTRMLEAYYDINKKDKFEKLFGETYIGKQPSKFRNSYYILRFNFSGTEVETFKENTYGSLIEFIYKYKFNFKINKELTASEIFKEFLDTFEKVKKDEKIYVIIDEYDHFINDLFRLEKEKFDKLVSKDNEIKKWYKVLKEGTKTVVDKIYITGVSELTANVMFKDLNFVLDLSKDNRFNGILGFTKEETKESIKNQIEDEKEQEKLLKVMEEYYNGYKFSLEAKEKVYNSDMCIYLLSYYVSHKELPSELLDINIASDCSKIKEALRSENVETKINIMKKLISNEGITIKEFNKSQQSIIMLYDLGYLTTEEVISNIPRLVIPNKAIKEIYIEYFLKILNEEEDLKVDDREYTEIAIEMLTEGKIEEGINLLQKYLRNLSNRDYQNFDEKYVKVIFYCIAMSLRTFWVKSELEVEREYQDILLVPKELGKGYYTILIEFKYLKKDEVNKLEEKQKEARKQIIRYSNKEEMKALENLKKFTIVAVNDKIYVKEIK